MRDAAVSSESRRAGVRPSSAASISSRPTASSATEPTSSRSYFAVSSSRATSPRARTSAMIPATASATSTVASRLAASNVSKRTSKSACRLSSLTAITYPFRKLPAPHPLRLHIPPLRPLQRCPPAGCLRSGRFNDKNAAKSISRAISRAIPKTRLAFRSRHHVPACSASADRSRCPLQSPTGRRDRIAAPHRRKTAVRSARHLWCRHHPP